MRLAGDLRVLKKSVHTGDVLPERGLCVRWTGFPPGVGGEGRGDKRRSCLYSWLEN